MASLASTYKTQKTVLLFIEKEIERNSLTSTHLYTQKNCHRSLKN